MKKQNNDKYNFSMIILFVPKLDFQKKTKNKLFFVKIVRWDLNSYRWKQPILQENNKSITNGFVQKSQSFKAKENMLLSIEGAVILDRTSDALYWFTTELGMSNTMIHDLHEVLLRSMGQLLAKFEKWRRNTNDYAYTVPQIQLNLKLI